MATVNNTIPLVVVDSLNQIMRSLDAYQVLSGAYLLKVLSESGHSDAHAIADGCESLFEPIAADLRAVIRQISDLRSATPKGSICND